MNPSRIRPAAVAGMFYPGDAPSLRKMVRRFLEEAPVPAPDPMALVAPHAGYVYSGFTAACGYRALAPVSTPRRVFLLGPCHRVYLEGVGVGDYDAFATPLGLVPVDREVVERLAREADVTLAIAPHQLEHSLEVHLPFLQETLGSFHIVPMVYGKVAGRRLAELLFLAWQPGDLIIASSDLSHYYPYEQARRLDQRCHDAVLARDAGAMGQCEACGQTGISALLGAALERDWQPVLADYRTSGDTAGDKAQVVGYASYLFYAGVGA